MRLPISPTCLGLCLALVSSMLPATAQYDHFIAAPPTGLSAEENKALAIASELSAKFDAGEVDSFYDQLNSLDEDEIWRENLSTDSIPQLIAASQIMSKLAYASEFSGDLDTVIVADGQNIFISVEVLRRDLEAWPLLEQRVVEVLIWAIYQRVYTFYELEKLDDAVVELADFKFALSEYRTFFSTERIEDFSAFTAEMDELLGTTLDQK